MPVDVNELRRKGRADHKALEALSRSCFVFLRRLDDLMREAKDIPNLRGKIIANMANELEIANDQVRYFSLGVNYLKDDKDAEWNKIKAGVG